MYLFIHFPIRFHIRVLFAEILDLEGVSDYDQAELVGVETARLSM